MSKPIDKNPAPEARGARAPEVTARISRHTRLHALLFAAGALGTTLVTLGVVGDGKWPRSAGE